MALIYSGTLSSVLPSFLLAEMQEVPILGHDTIRCLGQ